MCSPRPRWRQSKRAARGRQGTAPPKQAIRRADAVIGLNPADRDCVLPLLADPGHWVAIKPFLDAGLYKPLESGKPADRRG